jgi:hypothetical protein
MFVQAGLSDYFSAILCEQRRERQEPMIYEMPIDPVVKIVVGASLLIIVLMVIYLPFIAAIAKRGGGAWKIMSFLTCSLIILSLYLSFGVIPIGMGTLLTALIIWMIAWAFALAARSSARTGHLSFNHLVGTGGVHPAQRLQRKRLPNGEGTAFCWQPGLSRLLGLS